GARAEPEHPFAHLAARGQHDDGNGDAALAQLPTHRETVHPRQHPVEDDEVVAPAVNLRDGVDPTAANVGGVAFLIQGSRKKEGELRVVLDDEAPHGWTLPSPFAPPKRRTSMCRLVLLALLCQILADRSILGARRPAIVPILAART